VGAELTCTWGTALRCCSGEKGVGAALLLCLHSLFVLCFKEQSSLSNCHFKFYCVYPSCAKMEGKQSASVPVSPCFSFCRCSKGGRQTSAFRSNCADQRIHHLCLPHASLHLFSTPQFCQRNGWRESLGIPPQEVNGCWGSSVYFPQPSDLKDTLCIPLLISFFF